jgi:prevent-host-death family protein
LTTIDDIPFTAASRPETVHVAIRELKAGLSRVLARARAGEVIEVTSHNRPIARIVGIPDAEVGLRGLVASGAAAWAGGKPAFAPPLPLAPGGTPVSQLVLDERG